MNLNSLENFKAEAAALKMPASMQEEVIRQMESGMPNIAVTDRFPSRRGYLEATVHVKQSQQSDFYYFNRYDLALSKGKPLEEGKSYIVVSPGEEEGKNKSKKFDSPIAAMENFNKREGDVKLMIGKSAADGMTVAIKENGKVNYVEKEFQKVFYAPLIKNTVYVNRGVGFNMLQGANMLQGGSAYRDNLLSRDQQQYEAWNTYKFDVPRDDYGNLRIQQYGEGYGFKLEDQLAMYKIKELDDPKKMERILAGMKDGERQTVTMTDEKGENLKLYVEATPRYGNLSFYDHNGKAQVRENFLKEGLSKENVFSKKMEQGKQKGQEAGLSV